MSGWSIVAFIVIPLAIFLLTAAASGVVALIKLTSYFSKSREAQESTAESNQQIVKRLDVFIERTDDRLSNHGERIRVLEFAIDHKPGGAKGA